MTIFPRVTCDSATTVVQTTQPDPERKQRLRRELLAARLTADSAERLARDALLAQHLDAWLGRQCVTLLGVYWPIRGEPDLRRLYAQLSAGGMPLALPLMVDRESPLQFAAWVPGMALHVDRWGIATPATITLVTPSAMLVPCVGFNPAGFRLGYGGGYYDRTLARTPRARAIGIAYQEAAALFDSEAHDIAMDVVITEAVPDWLATPDDARSPWLAPPG